MLWFYRVRFLILHFFHFSELSLVVFAGVAISVAYWRMSKRHNSSNQNDLPRPVSEPVDLVATNEAIDSALTYWFMQNRSIGHSNHRTRKC